MNVSLEVPYGTRNHHLRQARMTLHDKARSVYSTAEYHDGKQDPKKLKEMLLHSKGDRVACLNFLTQQD